MSYLLFNQKNDLYQFRLVINPQADYFGEEDVICEKAEESQAEFTNNFKEGDFVTVIGRVKLHGWLPERPCIEFCDLIVPGEMVKIKDGRRDKK